MISSCHIIGSRRMGGAERFFVRLCRALCARGHPTHAILRSRSDLRPSLEPEVAISEVAMRGVWDLASRWRIRSLIRNGGATVAMSYMGRATRLTHLGPGAGVAHVARLGGYYDVSGYRHADAWVGNTRGICDYLTRAGLPAQRIFHISNFVDPAPVTDARTLQTLRVSLGLPEDAWVLVAVGRLHPNKAFDVLLRALALIPATLDGRPVRLLLVGDGRQRQSLSNLARALGVSDRVVFTGWQQQPSPYLQLGHLFVCPSRHEPLGNVILEAWNEGLPVVAADAAGPVELITDREDGILVPRDDARALAAALREVLGEGEDCLRKLAAGGRLALARGHGEEAVVGAFQDLFSSIKPRSPAGSATRVSPNL